MSLSGFRLHWAAAYASIVGLAMLLFARGDGTSRTVVLYVGINVLLVSQTLFFVQGLAVVRWFAISRQLRPGSRIALYIAAVLGQAAPPTHRAGGAVRYVGGLSQAFRPQEPGNGLGEVISDKE